MAAYDHSFGTRYACFSKYVRVAVKIINVIITRAVITHIYIHTSMITPFFPTVSLQRERDKTSSFVPRRPATRLGTEHAQSTFQPADG